MHELGAVLATYGTWQVPGDAADDGWALGALLGSQRTCCSVLVVPEKGAGFTKKREAVSQGSYRGLNGLG